MSNVLEGIGNTPLVRINRIGESSGLKCEICKLNSNGSNSQRMNMLRSVCKFKLELNTEEKGSMSYAAPEDAQRPRAV